MPGPEDLRGRLLGGRYRIGGTLGRGGMGTVYEAVQESLGRPVAVKILHPLLATDADTVARFRAEAERAGALSHPHIVNVLDFGFETGGLTWIAMERLEGESLGQRISRAGPLPPGEVVPIAVEALSALEAAHQARLVHRDLKPDNIFLARVAGVGQVVKVLDFGIAKLLDGGAAAALTSTGMVVGTPLYMSPEQAQGWSLDGRADLYSLGVVLFEALTGRPPFEAESYTALLIAIVTQAAPSLAVARPELDPALAAVVDRAMSKDPSARFGSAREMGDALRALPSAAEQGTRTTRRTPAHDPLALAETAQGPATPPPASAPAVQAVAAAESRTPWKRGPLVRPRWPRVLAIAPIVVVALATTTWLGTAMTGFAPRTESAPAPTRPPETVIEVPTDVPSSPQVLPGGEAVASPLPPPAPGADAQPRAIQDAGAERPAPGGQRPPGKVVGRPPLPGEGTRVTPSSSQGSAVPNPRAPFLARSDWATCWPPEEPAPLVNQSRCIDVTVDASGQVTRVVPRNDPPAFMDCVAQRTRTLRFAAPTTGAEATFRICFSIRPGPARPTGAVSPPR